MQCVQEGGLVPLVQIALGTGLEPQFGQELPQDIIVPFSIESPLSGLGVRGEQFNNMIYRRLWAPSLAQPGENIILHVDRADWHTKVFVNGVSNTIAFSPYQAIIPPASTACKSF